MRSMTPSVVSSVMLTQIFMGAVGGQGRVAAGAEYGPRRGQARVQPRAPRFAVAHGDAERPRRLLDVEAAEEAQLHQLGLARVERGQLVEGGVEVQQVRLRGPGPGGALDQGDAHAAAPLGRAAAARVVHEDAPHQPRGHREQLLAVLPGRVLRAQAHVGLVDEVGGPQRVAAPLAPQVGGRAPPQLGVDDRDQLVAGAGIALVPARGGAG